MTTKLTTLTLAASLAFTSQAVDLTVVFDADPVSLDPMEQISTATLQMGNLIFDNLIYTDSHMNYVPRLAESWEQISPTQVRFKIRQGVKFHSGNPLTVEDVIWTFNREITSPDFKALFTSYNSMKKVDDQHVDVLLKEPYPIDLVLTNMTYLFVMDSKFYTGTTADGKDKSAIEKNVGSFASLNASGSGPFKVTFRQQGIKLELTKNTDYWGKTGNVDKLTWIPIKENATRLAALLAGDVDWIYPVAPADLARVKASDKNVLYSIPSDRIITFQMNQKTVPAFKDKRVRQAVVYAINNAGIVKKIMKGFATTAGQNSPEGYSGYNPKLTPRYDLAKAKMLMKEAGYEKGFSIEMIAPNNRYVNDEKIAQAVAAMLKKINITVHLTTYPKAQYWPQFDKCAADMLMVGWSSDTGDSANYSEYLTMTRDAKTGKGAYNCGYYSNAKLDAIIKKSNTEINHDKRIVMLQKAAQIEYDEALYVPLHWQNLAYGYSKKITNFKDIVNLKNFPHFDQLIVK